MEPIHIAFADDHALVRKGVISMLQPLGGVIVDIQANDGRELIAELEKAAELPEICIIDISMPGMDGHTALLEIRKRWPKMKSLILTSFNDELHIISMMMAGANGYLLKDCDIEEMQSALESIRANGYHYSASANSTIFYLVETKSLKLPSFSDIEMEFIKICCSPLSISQIAHKMKISVGSAEGTRDRIFGKLNIKTRAELVLFAIKYGFISIEINDAGKLLIPKTKK